MDAVREYAVPDVIEPIVGWRYWRVDSHGRLRSLTGRQHTWRPGDAFTASCRFADVDPRDRRYQLVSGFTTEHHESPGEGCTCGVYASRDLERLRGHLLFGLRRMVVGEVALWGKVIPGQHGYRAQHGYPQRLCVFERVADGEHGLVDALAAYGVPVEVVSHRHASFRPLAALANATSTLIAPGRRHSSRTG